MLGINGQWCHQLCICNEASIKSTEKGRAHRSSRKLNPWSCWQGRKGRLHVFSTWPHTCLHLGLICNPHSIVYSCVHEGEYVHVWANSPLSFISLCARYMHVCMEAKGQCQVSSAITVHPTFWDRISHWIRPQVRPGIPCFSWIGWPINSRDPFAPAYKHVNQAWLLHGCCWYKLSFSSLHGKHFIGWATSLVLNPL